jgi:hypothetical protein
MFEIRASEYVDLGVAVQGRYRYGPAVCGAKLNNVYRGAPLPLVHYSMFVCGDNPRHALIALLSVETKAKAR